MSVNTETSPLNAWKIMRVCLCRFAEAEESGNERDHVGESLE